MKSKPTTRLLFFIMVAAFSLWVAGFWFDQGSLYKVVIYMGYPFIFIATALFACGMYLLAREDSGLKHLVPRKYSAWIVIGLVTGMLVLFEPYEFKIVFDELILSLSSQFLHWDRLSGLPRGANDYTGYYILLDAILDKRPFFFPFVLSLVHDFTGFRYQNVFFLNTALTGILITLIYVIAKRLSGHRGGLLAVLMAGTLPLLSIFATSGHLEILNLVMVCLVMLLSMVYLEQPDEKRIIPLVFGLILLCQVRYENSLYLLPMGILIILGWMKAGRAILPIPVILSPLFLIMSTLQMRMIQTSGHGFFQDGPFGRTDTFSLSYVSQNLVSAVDYLFNAGEQMSNSYLLSIFGLAGLLAYFYIAFKRAKYLTGKDPSGTAFYFFMLSIFLFCLVVGFFNFGLFDIYITARLSLPLQLLFILIIPYVLRRLERNYILLALLVGLVASLLTISGFDRSELVTKGLHIAILILAFTGGTYWLWKFAKVPRTAILAMPVIYILTTVMPIGHSHIYSQKYKSNDILMEDLHFIESRSGDEKILFVSGNQYAALLTKTNSAIISDVKEDPAILKEHLVRKHYTDIYVSRRMEWKDGIGFRPLNDDEALDPEIFVLEEVHCKPLTQTVYMEYARLVDVKL